jgi:hypothetical protein
MFLYRSQLITGISRFYSLWTLSLFHHLANHQMSAIHNGVTVSSAFLIPRANALTSEHTISRSARAPFPKEFRQLDLARAYGGFPRCAFGIYPK